MLAFRSCAYFPRISYFGLMLAADQFVIGDTFEYSRQSYHHRTRIRNPNGWQWLSIPIQSGQSRRILNEIQIDNSSDWQGQHWRSLFYNYRSSPFFEYYADRLQDLLSKEWDTLGEINVASIQLLQELLDIRTPVFRASDHDDRPSTPHGIWAAYGQPPVISLSDAASRNEEEIPQVEPLYFSEKAYHQNFGGFEPGMSAIDLLCNYGPESARLIRRWLSKSGPE